MILREISRAEHSIVLAVQEIRLPRIAKALVEKYRQGVDVKIIIEKDYNYNFNDLPIVAEEDKSTMPDPEEGNQYEIDRWSELFAFIIGLISSILSFSLLVLLLAKLLPLN